MRVFTVVEIGQVQQDRSSDCMIRASPRPFIHIRK